MTTNIETDSPYYSEGSEPTMLPSFVCYADILGYSQLSNIALSSGHGDDFLRQLSSSLAAAYEKIRDRANGILEGQPRRFDIKIFTDNIVIGYPVDNVDFSQGESELSHIFRTFSELQMQLSQDGFLLRGGVAFGSHYMDNDVVFGDALLAAVKEDKGGGPPCLTLDGTVIRKVKGQLAFYSDSTDTPQHYQLREDSDGKVFINYLSKVEDAFPEEPISFDLIAGHCRTIERGLNDYRSVPSVRSKYEWAARYHNYYCREMVQRYSKTTSDSDPEDARINAEVQRMMDHLIDIESFSAEPGPITLEPVWRGGD